MAVDRAIPVGGKPVDRKGKKDHLGGQVDSILADNTPLISGQLGIDFKDPDPSPDASRGIQMLYNVAAQYAADKARVEKANSGWSLGGATKVPEFSDYVYKTMAVALPQKFKTHFANQYIQAQGLDPNKLSPTDVQNITQYVTQVQNEYVNNPDINISGSH